MTLEEYIDACLAAIAADVKPQPGQHLLIIAYDDQSGLQMRIPGALDVTACVGSLHRAAFTMNQLQTLPPDEGPLTEFVEACLDALSGEDGVHGGPDQHLLLVAYDDAESAVQLRLPGEMKITRSVGALCRAATAVHSLRSLQSFRDDNTTGTP